MSIECYTGVPGSGKSYHTARRIYDALRSGVNVISNLNINTSIIPPKSSKKALGSFIYVPNAQWINSSIFLKSPIGGKSVCNDTFSYIYGLENFALQFHKRNKKVRYLSTRHLLFWTSARQYLIPGAGTRKTACSG